MEDIIHWGLIYEVSPTDYLLGADALDIGIAKRPPADTNIVEYNQLDLPNGQNSCTIHACVGAVSDLTGTVYSLADRQRLWDSALALDASETSGWYFWKAVDHIRRDWNKKNPDNPLVTFRINSSQPEFMEAMKRKHSLVGGYRGNGAYNKDAEDGLLEGTSFGDPTYGHCIRTRIEDGDVVVDNYLGKKLHNTYKLKDFAALIKNKVFFDEFYLFLPLKTMTEAEQKIIESEQKRAKAAELGIWNGKDGDKPVTRGEAAEMMMNMMAKIRSEIV